MRFVVGGSGSAGLGTWNVGKSRGGGEDGCAPGAQAEIVRHPPPASHESITPALPARATRIRTSSHAVILRKRPARGVRYAAVGLARHPTRRAVRAIALVQTASFGRSRVRLAPSCSRHGSMGAA